MSSQVVTALVTSAGLATGICFILRLRRLRATRRRAPGLKSMLIGLLGQQVGTGVAIAIASTKYRMKSVRGWIIIFGLTVVSMLTHVPIIVELRGFYDTELTARRLRLGLIFINALMPILVGIAANRLTIQSAPDYPRGDLFKDFWAKIVFTNAASRVASIVTEVLNVAFPRLFGHRSPIRQFLWICAITLLLSSTSLVLYTRGLAYEGRYEGLNMRTIGHFLLLGLLGAPAAFYEAYDREIYAYRSI
jgi:hypothetical protein